MSIVNCLVFNDSHGPWHDPEAHELMFQANPTDKIDVIIINGDLLDFYNINAHGPKHPEVATTLEDELSWGRAFLKHLRRRYPRQEINYLFGNHEDRLQRFMLNNCRALFDTLKLENLLLLNKLNIRWFPYNYRMKLGETNLWVQHSPPSYAVNGAMTSLIKDVDQSSIYGCSHRQQVATKTGKSGEVYQCYFNGWMGDSKRTPEHRRIFNYVKGHEAWQQCYSRVEVFKKEFEVNQISIRNGRAIDRGIVYG